MKVGAQIAALQRTGDRWRRAIKVEAPVPGKPYVGIGVNSRIWYDCAQYWKASLQ
jgi:hypothetical protein